MEKTYSTPDVQILQITPSNVITASGDVDSEENDKLVTLPFDKFR